MTETKLREKIKNIILGFCENAFSQRECINDLEFLFKQQIKEIIGEDEKYIKELPITEEIINCNDAIGYRNVLRKEQRKKAGIK